MTPTFLFAITWRIAFDLLYPCLYSERTLADALEYVLWNRNVDYYYFLELNLRKYVKYIIFIVMIFELIKMIEDWALPD